MNFITKFSELCSKLYKYKNNINSQSDFVDKIIKTQIPASSCSNSILKDYFSGRRSIRSTFASISAFKSKSANAFFHKYLREDKIDELLSAFEITCNPRNSFNYLCEALVQYFKLLVENDDDAISTTVCTLFTSIKNEPSLYFNKSPNVDDYEFISEVNNRCPLCGHKLIESSIDGKTKMYKISKIYPTTLPHDEKILFDAIKIKPTNLDSYENTIALCFGCALNYETNRNDETYKKLIEHKEKVIQRKKSYDALENMDVEKELDKTINSLLEITDRSVLTELSLDALKINQKIPETDICFDDVKTHVMKYFNYINSYLKKHEENTIDGSTILGKQIKNMSNKLMKLNCSPSQIIDYIAEELNRRIDGDSNSKKACEILIAYFVQHCEVLSNEVSK